MIKKLGYVVSTSLLLGPCVSFAQESGNPPLNFYGVPGIIDLPSAETLDEGELAANVTVFGKTMRSTLAFQITPRVTGTFRYTIIRDFGLDGIVDRYDRSFDIQYKLFEETQRRPSVLVGLQDFGGTGIFASEYIVATKNFSNRLTVSAGLGWGRLGSYNGFSNPLGVVADRFKTRPDTFRDVQNAGKLNFGDWFRGDMAVFGGASWKASDKWTLKFEYSSDAYLPEISRGVFEHNSPLNFGVEYALSSRSTLGLYYLYGSEVGVRISSSINPNRPISNNLEEAPPPVRLRVGSRFSKSSQVFGQVIDAQTSGSGYDGVLPTATVERSPTGVRIGRTRAPCSAAVGRELDAQLGTVDLVIFERSNGSTNCTVVLRPAGEAYVNAVSGRPNSDSSRLSNAGLSAATRTKLANMLAKEGLRLESAKVQALKATVNVVNLRYDKSAQAIGRTARVMSIVLPDSVEEFEIRPTVEGVAISKVTILRNDLESLEKDPDGAWRSYLRAKLDDAEIEPDRSEFVVASYPRLSGSILPYTDASFFEPDVPLRLDVGLRAVGRIDVAPGLSFSGVASKRLFGNIKDATFTSGSRIEPVRTLQLNYLREGDPRIDRLTGDYFFKISPETFGRVSAGIFEAMYGGISTEVVWKPVASNFALGAEVNWVKQRDFDQKLTFRDYETVTGHASLYWEMGNGFLAQVDAGRYLAKDLGATFSLSKEFNSGWSVGAYFTLTDVSFDDFGEGSFDKGINISVPLSWVYGTPQKRVYNVNIRPVQRDGGARVVIPNRLYPFVREYDRNSLEQSWGKFWR